MNLTPHDREILAGRPRHEQARLLLRGECGPLVALPFPPDVAAAAYLVCLAYRAARRPGEMLAGRPAYEAAETLLGRVLSVARCVGGLGEFGHELHQRLRLSTSRLHPDDQIWWLEARQTHASRWLHLSTDMALTEVCTAARLLDDLLWELGKTEPAIAPFVPDTLSSEEAP